jgi:hypothetical protein
MSRGIACERINSSETICNRWALLLRRLELRIWRAAYLKPTEMSEFSTLYDRQNLLFHRPHEREDSNLSV